MSRLINKILAEAAVAELYVPKTTFSIARTEMPQITSPVIPEFIEFLKANGVATIKTTINVAKLKPIQREINLKKVEQMLTTLDHETALKKPIFISKDLFLLDGHHRWLALLNENQEYMIDAYQARCDIKTLLYWAKKFPKTTYKTIHEAKSLKEAVTLYHGSKAKFDKFDDSLVSSGEGGDKFGAGFYLTDNPEIADFYAHHVAKKDYVTKVTYDGILGSPRNHYSNDADEKAAANKHINEFIVDGKILDCDTFTIDKKLRQVFIQSVDKHSGWHGDNAVKLVDNTLGFIQTPGNKEKVRNFRGELEYCLDHIAMGDKDIVNDIINYIKSLGYDGIRYAADLDYEGNSGSHNYVIYNSNAIRPKQ